MTPFQLSYRVPGLGLEFGLGAAALGSPQISCNGLEVAVAVRHDANKIVVERVLDELAAQIKAGNCATAERLVTQ